MKRNVYKKLFASQLINYFSNNKIETKITYLMKEKQTRTKPIEKRKPYMIMVNGFLGNLNFRFKSSKKRLGRTGPLSFSNRRTKTLHKWNDKRGIFAREIDLVFQGGEKGRVIVSLADSKD